MFRNEDSHKTYKKIFFAERNDALSSLGIQMAISIYRFFYDKKMLFTEHENIE